MKNLINRGNPMIFNRTDLINYIIETKKYKSYLEIGCFNNQNYDKIIATVKVGIDPKSGGTIRKTSDDFFSENNQTFDLIFIDGLHHSEQVTKDVDSSLKFLNQNGEIVLHDYNPLTEDAQKVPSNGQRM
jgi:predicted O-methyltransferase YrrM